MALFHVAGKNSFLRNDWELGAQPPGTRQAREKVLVPWSMHGPGLGVESIQRLEVTQQKSPYSLTLGYKPAG